jgi:hypothetical protein
MAANKIVRFGPVVLSNTLTTNILNPGTTTGGVGMPASSTNTYFVLRHVRITNVTATPATFTMCIGATGATASSSNSFMGFGTSVPANSYVDWYGMVRLDTADFLVGGAGTATALTFEAEGELGIV